MGMINEDTESIDRSERRWRRAGGEGPFQVAVRQLAAEWGWPMRTLKDVVRACRLTADDKALGGGVMARMTSQSEMRIR